MSRGTKKKPRSGAVGDQRGVVRNVAPMSDRDVVIDGNLLDADGTVGWTAFSNDTTGLEREVTHMLGEESIEFDKVNGADNQKYAGIYRTDAQLDLSRFLDDDLITGRFYVSATTDIAAVHVRLGTDASNYSEWTMTDAEIGSIGGWTLFKKRVSDVTYAVTANGWDSANVKYVAFLVEFDAETDALADIRLDHLMFRSVQGERVDPLNIVNLASVTAATDGTGVDTSRYGEKTVYVQVSGNTGAVKVDIQHSPDNTTWFDLDSKTYTAVNREDDWSYASHFPWMRTRTSSHANATVKTTITGKAG
jgi:hypothetical protein